MKNKDTFNEIILMQVVNLLFLGGMFWMML